MLIGKEFDVFFIRAIKALEDYASDIVCVGGCANALYRYHELAAPASLAYVGTHDLDLAVNQKMPIRHRRSIARIMEESGMKEEVFGSSNNAVVKYCPTDVKIAADIEFLCPSSGLKGTRGRKTPPSHEVQKGLMAQPLRYMELLLYRPWTIDVGRIPGFDALAGIRLQIPNPASYVMQKILIQEEGRKRESMAKDYYYMFEVSVIFRDSLNQLKEEFDNIADAYPKKWITRFRTNLSTAFRDAHAEGSTLAARLHDDIKRDGAGGGMPVDEEIVAASMQRMIQRVF